MAVSSIGVDIHQARVPLSEKRENGMALKKRDFMPESGNVDTYDSSNAFGSSFFHKYASD